MKQCELDQLAREYFEMQKQIDDLTAACDAIKDQMKSVMIENSVEDLYGIGWRATWHNTTTNRFDSTAFKKAHSDLYAAFCKPSNGTRFTLNQIRGGV